MYVPAAYRVDDPAEIAAMLAAPRLALLVTHGRDGLTATHLPMLHDAERQVMVGHLARPNPQAQEGSPQEGAEAMAVFQGVAGYISPSWYPSKAEHGRVVPTWNYEAVHVHGRLTRFDDPARLLSVVRRISDAMEGGRQQPWSVDDAPADYVARLLGTIMGVELAIERIDAKRKLSQDRPPPDRLGVIAGLQDEPDPAAHALAAAMAAAGDR